MNILKGKLKYLNILFKKTAPFIAVYTVNSLCNANCPECFVKKPDNVTNKSDYEIPIDKAKKVIKELSDLGCIEITLQGGEALLRDDIGEIIDFCKSVNLRVHIVTNGMLITKRKNEMKKVDAVHISLDGSKEFTNKNKGNSEYYDKAIEGLAFLKENNIKTSLCVSLLPGIYNELDFLFNLSKKYNTGLQFLSIFVPDKNDASGARLIQNISDEEYIKTLKKIYSAPKKGVLILPSEYSIKKALGWTNRTGKPYKEVNILKKDSKYNVTCKHGRKAIFIDENGFVEPCCMFRLRKANCYEVGVKKSLDIISKLNPCSECISLPLSDIHAVFSYKFPVILNYFKLTRICR